MTRRWSLWGGSRGSPPRRADPASPSTRSAPFWSHLVGAAAVIGAVALVTTSAYAHQQRSVLPTVASVAGTCHADQDPLEMASVSDTGPAVRCNRPHQTETGFQLPITGALAAQASRPNPELLESTYSRQCVDYVRIRRFLGARAPDVYWGLDAVARFPTPAEWTHHVRVLVCDYYNGDHPGGPLLSVDLAGILTRRDSAAFRLCRLGSTLSTCDRPHDAEATSPNLRLPAGPWPGTAGERAEAVQACAPVVAAYLGAPVVSKPGLSIEPTPLTRRQWDDGARTVDCWISTSGTPSTGSVRGGLG